MEKIYLEWRDSAIVGQGAWIDPMDLDLDPLPCNSVGFLVDEDDDFIAVASSGTLNTDGSFAFAGVITIPKACITKRRVLK